MSRLTSRGFTQDDAEAFMARSREPHTLQWKADAYRYTAGTAALLMEGIPIVSGRLTLDSSDTTRRRLSLEVGGGDVLVPEDSTDPLVPFGQVVFLWVRLDLSDGTWSPWLKMGEYPIITHVYERPSQVTTVEAADYSHVVDEFLHLSKKGYGNRSLKAAIVDMVEQALPNRAFAVQATAAAQQNKITNYTAEAGAGRWETATDLAAIKGHETFFDANGDLIIRGDVTDDNDDVIPGVGPDIGTVSDPVAVINDGPSGNLVAMTATLTREGACNGVVINIHETKRRTGDDRKNVQVQVVESSGAAAWGDQFGRIPIVDERSVKTITDGVVSDQKSRAKRMLHRRRGVVRYIDLDATGLYWIEPDDKVTVRWGSGTATERSENHFVQRVEFDLSGRNPIRIKTRQLAVRDPGA